MDELVCSSCSNYLSIFPIYLIGNKSNVLCGRCTPFNRDNLIRDEAYEAIAEFLQFPCCYKKNGCREELTPYKLEGHEVTCPFKLFECPTKIYTRCEWLGAGPDLLGHFEEDHSDLLLKTDEFRWSFGTSHKENLLMSFQDELFVVKKESDELKQCLSCSVQRFAARSNSKHYNYIIKLLSHSKDFWCKLPEKSTEDPQSVTVSREYIKEKLNDPESVIIQIEIVQADESKRNDSSETPVDVEKNPNLNWEMLNQLECPVCYDIMRPEIYQCANGHSICSRCKFTVQLCPLCRSNDMDIRNYSLEKITPFLKYPCKFYKSGCNYVSKSSEIMKHEETCEFGPCECPLKKAGKCQMKIDKSKIFDHIERNHSSFILKSSRVTSPFNVNETRESFYLIKYSATSFLVRYKYENGKFYWTVQMMGSTEECKKFKFDIDVIDNSKNKLRCYLKGFCVSMQENINFDDPRKYIMLTYEQLQPLIVNTVDYNIHIIAE